MSRLTDRQDAYGHMVCDLWRGHDVCEVAECDDGYVGTGSANYLAGFRDWPAIQRRAIRLARGRVLDIGCGAGRVALYLQAKGHDVLGVDSSPLAIRLCRERGLTNAKVLPITELARRRVGRFDTIVMYGNNFGLFGGLKRGRWLLRRFLGMTADRGRIIAETTDPYDTSNPRHLAYHRLNRRRGRMGGQLRLRIRYLQYATPWFDYLLASRDEVRTMLAGTGWRLSRTFDSKGPTYVAIIEKER